MMMSECRSKSRLFSCYCVAATSSITGGVASTRCHHHTALFVRGFSTRLSFNHSPPRLTNFRRSFGTKDLAYNIIDLSKTRLAGKSNDIENNNNDDVMTVVETDKTHEADSHKLQLTDEEVESHSLKWIRQVVIGYNLCPFAEKPMRDKTLQTIIVRGQDDEEIASSVVYELVSRSRESNPGTTIVVAPDYYPTDFTAYMSLVQYIEEDVMENLNLHGIVQLAPFHPQFVFEGSAPDGIDNYTNRSPYPMFHILREDEVSRAVDKLDGDAGKVWRRNIDLLESMVDRFGKEGAVRAMMIEMEGLPLEGMHELLREVKDRSSSSSSSGQSGDGVTSKKE